ncbi:MAG: hypothetical protein JWL77_5562 [Chthonomonadaceae bacterium]|nr:hypothetical protein [Chthonomonadaceae bacterium]
MNFKRLLGMTDQHPEDEGEGPVVLTIEFRGKTYTRRYPDFETAQMRFPEFLADMATLHSNTFS